MNIVECAVYEILALSFWLHLLHVRHPLPAPPAVAVATPALAYLVAFAFETMKLATAVALAGIER